MTSKEMMHTTCKNGQHFENIARLGENPDWVLRDYPLESVDPSVNYIFGDEEKSFLARQYK